MEQLEVRSLLSTVQGTVTDGVNPVPGATVYLDQNANGFLDSGETSTTTDSSGNYSLAAPAPGIYTVAQVPPGGWMQTSPAQNPGPGLLGDVLSSFAAPTTGPFGLAFANGYLYLTGYGSTTVYKIAPATGAVAQTFALPESVKGLTYDGTHFWAVGSTLIEFDSSWNVIQRLAAPDPSPWALAWDGSSLRISDSQTNLIYSVDPSTGNALSSIPAPATRVFGLVFDGTHLWADSFDTNLTYALDPGTGRVLTSFASPRNARDLGDPVGLADDGQSLWMIQYVSGTVFRVDRSLPGEQTVDLTVNPSATANFTDFQLGSISGHVTTSGGSSPAGWRVYLDENGDGNYEIWEPSALSDATGAYTISGLRANTYTVREVSRQPGWTPNTQVYTASIATSGQNVTGNDFSNTQTGLGPVGPEFLVNTTTAGAQSTWVNFNVASDTNGNFVVVWYSANSANPGFFAQRFDSSGNTVGGEMTIASGTFNSLPKVAMAANSGNFVVAWTNTSNGGAYARLYNASTNTLGAPFVVTSNGFIGSVAMGADGSFDILFGANNRFGQHTWNLQRYTATGATAGSAIKVATPTLVNGEGSVAMDGKDNSVVVWDDTGSNNTFFVYAQRYSNTGKAVGSRIQVNPSTVARQWQSAVAMDAAGDFAVSWSSNAGNVFRILNADGTFRTGPISLGSGGAPGEMPVPMAWKPDGSTLTTTWSDTTPSNNSSYAGDVYAEQFSSTGAVLTAPFLINTTIAGSQNDPSVAVAANGNFVIAWSGNGVGDDSGVFAQRFASPSTLAPAASAATSPSPPLLEAQASQPLGSDILTTVALDLAAVQAKKRGHQ